MKPAAYRSLQTKTNFKESLKNHENFKTQASIAEK